MSNQLILYPVLAHIFLVFGLYILLGKRKSAARRSKTVDLKKAALDTNAWPGDVIQVSNCITNQFQTPVIFYVLSMILLTQEFTNVYTLGLAWIFVLARYIHAYVHVGSNYVPMRFRFFLIATLSLLILTGMVIALLLMK